MILMQAACPIWTTAIVYNRAVYVVARAIIFDLNGVVADDESLHFRSFENAAIANGFELDQNSYKKFFAGKTDSDGLTAFLEGRGLAGEGALHEALKREKQSQYRAATEFGVKVFPDALRLAARAKSRGIAVAIASNASGDEVRRVVADLEVFGEPTVVVARSGHSGAKPKPDPDLYLRAASELKLDPSECLAIEDTPAGIFGHKSWHELRCGHQHAFTRRPTRSRSSRQQLGRFRGSALPPRCVTQSLRKRATLVSCENACQLRTARLGAGTMMASGLPPDVGVPRIHRRSACCTAWRLQPKCLAICTLFMPDVLRARSSASLLEGIVTVLWRIAIPRRSK